MSHRILEGKTILVTRQNEQAADLVASIEQLGGRARVVPMIRIADPESWDECDAALARIGSYDMLVFSSANGVERFFRRCATRGVEKRAFHRLKIFAVGATTREAVLREGCNVHSLPESFSGASLADHLRHEAVGDRRVLLPRGAQGREELASELASLGAHCDSVTVYRTLPPDERAMADILRVLTDERIDVVSFASPSAVKHFSAGAPPAVLSNLGHKVLVAVIGPTTREAAERLGYHVDIVSDVATAAGFSAAIARYCEAHP